METPNMPTPVPSLEELIQEVLAHDAAATPGPWDHPHVQDGEILPDGTGYAGDWEPDLHAVVYPAGPDHEEEDVTDCPHPEDAALIVCYRTAAPRLAREVLRLREELAALRRAVEVAS